MKRRGKPQHGEQIRAQHELIDKYLEDSKSYVVFTDGSSLNNPGPTGASAVLVTGVDVKSEPITQSFTFPQRATNNLGELKGIDLALDLLKEQHAKEKRNRWIILTDSRYVCGALGPNKAHKNAEVIQALKTRIQTLQTDHGVVVSVEWIRSHCGHQWNELVDSLAVAAAQKAVVAKKRKSIGDAPRPSKRQKPNSATE